MPQVPIIVGLLLLFGLPSCQFKTEWDDGAQKQESMEREKRSDQDSSLNNQLPDNRPKTDQQPF